MVKKSQEQKTLKCYNYWFRFWLVRVYSVVKFFWKLSTPEIHTVVLFFSQFRSITKYTLTL